MYIYVCSLRDSTTQICGLADARLKPKGVVCEQIDLIPRYFNKIMYM